MKNTKRGQLIAYYRRLNGLTQQDLLKMIRRKKKPYNSWQRMKKPMM